MSIGSAKRLPVSTTGTSLLRMNSRTRLLWVVLCRMRPHTRWASNADTSASSSSSRWPLLAIIRCRPLARSTSEIAWMVLA